MLNRRTLRIKAMQSLFAFERSKASNFNIAKDRIAEAFAPDLNSMEVQDKVLLTAQKKEATALFVEYYAQQIEVKASAEDKINLAVNNNITTYFDDVKKDKKVIEKHMINEAEGLMDQYVMILLLLTEFADIAATDSKYKTDNFVNNVLIKAIKFNKPLENIILRHQLSWGGLNDELREWYRDTIRTTDMYQDYLKLESPSFDQDKEIVEYVVKTIVFKSDVVTAYMEEKDLYWTENKAIVKSMVLKTIKAIDPEKAEDFEPAELSYNWEEDKEFFINIFKETLDLDKEYKDLIASKTVNWDIERLASVDRIIMEMAITEMLNFRSIPLKVTINEYIELAKNYSTPNSKQFINGILDGISKELNENGKIRKSGRGLIDNK
jgi:N utilization substance protein B